MECIFIIFIIILLLLSQFLPLWLPLPIPLPNSHSQFSHFSFVHVHGSFIHVLRLVPSPSFHHYPPLPSPLVTVRHVPWQKIEPVTFWFPGQHSTHWATPARAGIHYWLIYYESLDERVINCFLNNSCFRPWISQESREKLFFSLYKNILNSLK